VEKLASEKKKVIVEVAVGVAVPTVITTTAAAATKEMEFQCSYL